jgi:hypothetical protein
MERFAFHSDPVWQNALTAFRYLSLDGVHSVTVIVVHANSTNPESQNLFSANGWR